MLKVLVCGSREWPSYHQIRKRLALLPRGTTIIHGGARGADKQAGTIARALDFEERVFPADWKRYGKRAGILRNIEMLEAWPDLVIAFILNNSSGSEHTVLEAKRRGIPVEIHRMFIEDGQLRAWVEEYEGRW